MGKFSSAVSRTEGWEVEQAFLGDMGKEETASSYLPLSSISQSQASGGRLNAGQAHLAYYWTRYRISLAISHATTIQYCSRNAPQRTGGRASMRCAIAIFQRAVESRQLTRHRISANRQANHPNALIP